MSSKLSTEPIHPEIPRRKALKVAASALCAEVGFSHAEDSALETLTEMLQSYLTEVGRCTQAFAELACRTEPMLTDVIVSLIEMGFDVQSLPAYAKRPNKMVFMPPAPSGPAPNARTLQAGQRKEHPPHIPDYMPPFPDPHTYIHTPMHKKPVTDYQTIREKAASQKRDVERALTRFIAKTGETESLFQDDPYAYPLIACKPKPLPYLDALLPKDIDIESQDEEEQKQIANKKQEAEKAAQQAAKTEESQASQTQDSAPTTPNKTTAENNANNSNLDIVDTDSQIDNPYLRPIKMPKLKGVRGKSKY